MTITHSQGTQTVRARTNASGRFISALLLPTEDGRANVTVAVGDKTYSETIGAPITTTTTPPEFNVDGVKVNSLKLSTSAAAVNSNVSATYSIQANKSVTFEYLVAAVRDSKNIDGPALDFTNERKVTVNGEHSFTSSRTWNTADTYAVHVAYSIDGIKWTHLVVPTVSVLIGGSTTTLAPNSTTTSTTSATTTSTTATSAGRWLSGAGGTHSITADPAQFAAYRGEPVTYATVWTYPEGYSSHEQLGVSEFTKRGYAGTLNMSVPWPTGTTWASAANGGLDAYWTQMIDTIVEDWGSMRQVQLSFAYEFNGTWMAWSINGQTSDFGKAWKRMYNIVQARKGSKDIKIVLPFSAGPQSGAGATIDQMVQAAGTSYFDIIGVDMYDAWFADGNDGNIKTQAEWDSQFYATAGSLGPRGFGAWQAYAKQLGKPISFPEWGLSDRRDVAIVDNPFFVQKVNEFFRSIAPSDPYKPGAGQLAGEALFNTWDQCQLFPVLKAPNSSAKYAQLTWGS